MKKNIIIRQITAVMLALALVITAFAPLAADTAFAAGSAQKSVSASATPQGETVIAETTVTGYPEKINKRRSSTVKIKATISPAGGRKVILQRYNHRKQKWTSLRTVYAGNSNSASARVSITIPAKYRNRTTGYWRIYVPKTKTADMGLSKNITVTTRNVKSTKLTARAAVVYRVDGDNEGTLLCTKNSGDKLAQASTTKLMTAILLLESGKLNTKTKISAHAAATPWGSGHLSEGDIYYTKDLLYAMLLPSSNDAAVAVAEKVGGTEEKFVAMMNARAKSLGLTHTHFRNPHGLDANGHYTTAAELARLTAFAYTFPEIRDCWATNKKTITCVNTGRKWTLWSTNAIFSYVKEFLGGKTGTEDNARCCFTGVYKYQGKIYVTVVLGSDYGFARWSDTKKLHSYIKNYAETMY